jgi:indolepyruvate decarboxylase
MPSVADFLVDRLENLGVGHVFGISRDDGNPFVESISTSKKMRFAPTTDEAGAGFAADTYARVAGVGCVCSTYNAGALSLCNAISGAYSERSPVVVVSISPPMKSRNEDFLLHHVLRSFNNQQRIFNNITCNAAMLDDATKAGFLIDKALDDMATLKQPIYIEMPADVAKSPIRYDVYSQGTPTIKASDKETLTDALDETNQWLSQSKSPVIMVGVQIVRYGLSDKLVRFAEKNNIPMVTTLLGKSSIDENHELFAGVYGGKSSRPEVLSLIDNSDCLLVFGECLTDMSLGFESPRFAKRQVAFCSTDGLFVKNHVYNNVTFQDFCMSLFSSYFEKKDLMISDKSNAKSDDILGIISKIMDSDKNLVMVSDCGKHLATASMIKVRQKRFFSPAFQRTGRFAMAGCVGLQLANTELRPLVMLDVDSLRSSLSDVSTIINMGLNPIVLVLGDAGVNTASLRDFFGGGHGYMVSRPDELESTLRSCLKSKEISILSWINKKDN